MFLYSARHYAAQSSWIICQLAPIVPDGINVMFYIFLIPFNFLLLFSPLLLFGLIKIVSTLFCLFSFKIKELGFNLALRSVEYALPAERLLERSELAGKSGGERKKGENHFMGDTVKDLFEQAASLSVLLY